MDAREHRIRFGIYFRTPVSSDEIFDCSCQIASKSFQCQFRCESAESLWDERDFLSHSELEEFLEKPSKIQVKMNRELKNDGGDMSKMSHVRKVIQDLKQLLLSGEESDTTVRVQGQEFRAHRSILVARSPVFASMFRHDTKERATGVVDLEDCEASVFPVLLEYLYCGSTENISADNVFGLYASADMYDVPELKSECLRFIRNSLSVDTFCETMNLALQHSEDDLMKLSVVFFAKNMKKIVKTAKWQSFLLENPIRGNEILIKALGSDGQDD